MNTHSMQWLFPLYLGVKDLVEYARDYSPIQICGTQLWACKITHQPSYPPISILHKTNILGVI